MSSKSTCMPVQNGILNTNDGCILCVYIHNKSEAALSNLSNYKSTVT